MFKGQSAIEYLMTYGWMLLVVAITGGAIFSIVGGQSIESVEGFDSTHVTVSDFGTTAASLQMVVEGRSQGITLKEITISDNGENVSIPLDNNIDLGGSKTVDLPHIREKDETNEIDVELKYDAGSLENITSSGTIIGDIGLDNSLIGYWPLSENQANETHVYDVSGNDHSGEFFDLEFVTDNENGRVSNFDGQNTHIVVPHDEKLNSVFGGFEWTLVAWVKPKAYEDYSTVITKSPGCGSWSCSTASIWNYDSGLRAVKGTAESGNPSGSRARVAHDPELGEWHHVVAASDGENVYLYTNGDSQGSEEITDYIYDNLEPHEGPLTMGRRSESHSESIDAKVSDVMAYDRFLSENEIRALYRSGGLIE